MRLLDELRRRPAGVPPFLGHAAAGTGKVSIGSAPVSFGDTLQGKGLSAARGKRCQGRLDSTCRPGVFQTTQRYTVPASRLPGKLPLVSQTQRLSRDSGRVATLVNVVRPQYGDLRARITRQPIG
ncbi:hypothetical protein D3C72_1138180 [compost metagenome]